MAIDASIFARFQQPQRSALDTFEQLQGLDARRQQMQDNALTRSFAMQDRQRKMAAEDAAMQRGNALQRLVDVNRGKPEEEVIGAVRGAGYLEDAARMEKDLLDRRGKRATTVKTEGDALSQALGNARMLWGQVQSPDQAQRLLQAQYADPVLSPILTKLGTLEQALGEMPRDPKQWAQWRDTQAMGIEAVQKAMFERDKANKPPAPPASVAEYEYAKQQGFKGTLEQWVTSKAKASAAQTSVNYSQPVEAVDAQGNRVFIRTTKDGMAPAIIPGVRPPMSAAEERAAGEKSTRERQGRQMASGIEDARKILDAGKATGSGIGNLVDAGARLFGQTTVGAQDAARLEALSGWLVANVPRMEGPQSNIDVQNYTTMAGKIGDRTVPIAERKAALAEVERLQRKYADINGTPMPAAAGTDKVRRYNPATGKIE